MTNINELRQRLAIWFSRSQDYEGDLTNILLPREKHIPLSRLQEKGTTSDLSRKNKKYLHPEPSSSETGTRGLYSSPKNMQQWSKLKTRLARIYYEP